MDFGLHAELDQHDPGRAAFVSTFLPFNICFPHGPLLTVAGSCVLHRMAYLSKAFMPSERSRIASWPELHWAEYGRNTHREDFSPFCNFMLHSLLGVRLHQHKASLDFCCTIFLRRLSCYLMSHASGQKSSIFLSFFLFHLLFPVSFMLLWVTRIRHLFRTLLYWIAFLWKRGDDEATNQQQLLVKASGIYGEDI